MYHTLKTSSLPVACTHTGRNKENKCFILLYRQKRTRVRKEGLSLWASNRKNEAKLEFVCYGTYKFIAFLGTERCYKLRLRKGFPTFTF